MPPIGSVVARLRVVVFLLVSVLLVVPPVVRAAGHLPVSKPSPLRLSRGFELPPTRSVVVPPTETVPPVSSAAEPAAPPVCRRASAADDALPISPPDRSPDALRGPPQQ